MNKITLDSGVPLLVQVWCIPGILKPGESFQIDHNPPVTFRGVEFKSGPKSKSVEALLIESSVCSPDCCKHPEREMNRIGKLLTRLGVGLLGPVRVISSRILPDGISAGTEIQTLNFPGEPPGIALFESRIAFERRQLLDTSLLEIDVREDVQEAMSWFLLGLRAVNPVQRFLFHWIGLEMVAPEQTGPWRCASCSHLMEACPQCRKSTATVRAVKTMQDYIVGSLGISKKHFDTLYEARCKITHGGAGLTGPSNDGLPSLSLEVETVLLRALKRESGLNMDGPPTILQSGMTILGSPAIGMTVTVNGPEFYDSPGPHTPID